MAKRMKTMDELVDGALRQFSFDATVVRGQVESAYRKVVGPFLVKLTTHLYYESQTHVLYVTVASPAMRQEMQQKVGDLLKAINAQLGKAHVRYLVLR